MARLKRTAKTANEQIFQDMVRHQTYLARYGKSLSVDAKIAFEATEDVIYDLVLKYGDKLQGLPITSPGSRKLMAELKNEIEFARGKAWSAIESQANEELTALASIEQLAAINIIQGSLPIMLGLQPLPVKQLQLIAMATPFEGRTLGEWLKHNQGLDTARIVNAAKIGIMQGETPTQLARRAVGTHAFKRGDGQLKKAMRDMEAVYLTVTNGIQNEVKQALYAEHSDIIHDELYVATLDIATTLACAGNDGKRFAIGTGPMPPLHFRCRSLRIPSINPNALRNRGFDSSYEKLLLNEYTDANKLDRVAKYADLPRGHKTKYNAFTQGRKRELVGQVPATRNFDTWLRGESKEFQDEYLGKAKGQIFRDGKLSLDKFTTNDGSNLTIKQLEKL